MPAADESCSLSAHGRAGSRIDSVACGSEMLIVAAGELDLVLHPELRSALSAAAQVNVTLDMTDVSFVDLSTIALLAHAAAKRVATGRRTAIFNCQPQVRRVFWLAQAQHLLSP